MEGGAPAMRRNLMVRGNAVELRDDPLEDPASQRFNLDLVLDHPVLAETARAFAARAVVPVSHSAEQRVVCVLQREFAVVRTDAVAMVGSDDATTCVMVFVALGRAVCCGHIDDAAALGTKGCAVVKMYQALAEAAAQDDVDAGAPLRAWIVGGFCDERLHSAATVALALAALNALPRPVELQLVFAERVNNKVVDGVPHPLYWGAAYSSALDTVVPAHWTHLGPAIGLRAALPCCGIEELMPCYDWRTDELAIHFPYSEFEAAPMLLETPDEFLLENVSSSGPQEPPRFLTTLRAALRFLVDHPHADDYFENGPVRFQRSSLGAWVRTAP